MVNVMKNGIGVFLLLVAVCGAGVYAFGAHQPSEKQAVFACKHTDAEWRKILSPDAYKVLRQAGTERAYTGKYWDNHEQGIYKCAGCGQQLFSSATKFNSGTGWPSFYQTINKKAVLEQSDRSLEDERTEVLCSKCGGHLGHVFPDGPRPTGLRYCMNSVAMTFVKAPSGKKH